MTWFDNVRWEQLGSLFPGEDSDAVDDALPWKCVSEVAPGLYLSCAELMGDRHLCTQRGISLVLNLCAGGEDPPYSVEWLDKGELARETISGVEEFARQLNHYTSEALPPVDQRKVFVRSVAALDIPTYDMSQHFPELCTLLEICFQNREALSGQIGAGQRVHAAGVHCMVGVSRSVTIVAAYLMKKTNLSRDDILSFLRLTRPVIGPNPGFFAQLTLFEELGCYHFVDEDTALMTATEMKRKKNVVEAVNQMLPALLKQNKCAPERKYFGLVIQNSGASNDDMDTITRELRSYVTASIDCEEYADIPNFFGYVCEIIESVERYCPAILSTMSTEATDVVLCDQFYQRVFRVLGRSGFEKDTYDTVRAFISLLEMIHLKHLKGLPRVSSPSAVLVPPTMCLSFNFLTLVAPYAEGFVDFNELECSRDGEGTAALFLRSFMMSSTGLKTPADGGEPQWSSNSRLSYLVQDVEVQLFEKVRGGCAVTELNFAPFFEPVADRYIGLLIARKVVSGVLAFRLILETIHTLVQHAYSSEASLDSFDPEKKAPIDSIKKVIDGIEALYNEKYGGKANLLSYFREELEPLLTNHVVTSDGVIQIFTL
ncbi:dual-specificity protein phosphatase [Angomonas deanei]|uniref:Dual specificity phosphatase, catalytic domain containing protein, putative n=1 Tax=Angomonas deanei TaxID=59799 RepID=S9VPM3_9TRYP|nr:dual-specificity protein phosphatase [Angomonas deanei]EPY34907.1 dual-specificity protein phosphatase [Angomonas deanei]CAD2218986.1 Dual specificity phosphatase, catalytic domain containing protein, putative [Angomonas deanei]|eukprot:EPY25200.1 dual-specificity protein phosphatase [Angomonas deanei]